MGRLDVQIPQVGDKVKIPDVYWGMEVVAMSERGFYFQDPGRQPGRHTDRLFYITFRDYEVRVKEYSDRMKRGSKR